MGVDHGQVVLKGRVKREKKIRRGLPEKEEVLCGDEKRRGRKGEIVTS